MTREEIAQTVDRLLADEFEIDQSLITPDAPLKETLGLDSLDLVDIVVLINQHFGITLKGPDFVGIATFDDFYRLLDTRLHG
ncbi:acyl carrier protein [uncultured Rikenella sp.]|uniref:acyl carrier protein n=1 Tax=uncultured Rikenella sp. TaxID=368003 RepID=UPI0026233AC2|nr:phosphopantetheine-binding protein [uncultured Rikenella sp.]